MNFVKPDCWYDDASLFAWWELVSEPTDIFGSAKKVISAALTTSHPGIQLIGPGLIVMCSKSVINELES